MSHPTRRAPPLLSPRARTPATLAVIGLLAGLAAAALVTIGAALALAQPILGQRLAGSMTVFVSGRLDSGALESSDAAAARAREILAGLRGVSGVRVLEPATIDGVLARIVAAGPSSRDTGPPRLLAVGLAATGPDARAAVARALGAEALIFAIDDHGLWSGPCERLEVSFAVMVALGLFACWLALGAAAAWAIGHRIDGAWSRLDLLSQLGADPARLGRAIASPMAGRSAAFAAAGAILGAGLCWLRWPAAAPIAPPILPIAGGAAAWLVFGALVAQGLGRRAADRRLQSLFS
jgi:cell division transport system permease protein